MLQEIDVIMPVAPKDKAKAGHSLKGILQNSLNPIRNIYIVTPGKFALEGFDNVSLHWILDAEFPFSVNDIRNVFQTKNSSYENASWYYQQLLKFYAFIEDLFYLVEQEWGRMFWQAFINKVDVSKWNGAAEYVIYHHFALWRHPQKVFLRHLNACDIIFDAEDQGPSLPVIKGIGEQNQYNAVGFHSF